MKKISDSPIYTRLSTDSEAETAGFAHVTRPSQSWKSLNLCISVLWFSGAVMMLASATLMHTRPSAPVSPDLVYSPAQDRVRYEQVSFPSFHSKSAYQAEPSPEVDELWENLYNFGISWITASEASRLPNKTSAIPGTDTYITGLDVFHQLHCLNMVRQALNPHYYKDHLAAHEDGEGSHVGHCIEHLRLAIMCNADISTVYWQWNAREQVTQADARVTHTCRDFEAIREWGRERRVEQVYDYETFVGGNPVFKEEDYE